MMCCVLNETIHSLQLYIQILVLISIRNKDNPILLIYNALHCDKIVLDYTRNILGRYWDSNRPIGNRYNIWVVGYQYGIHPVGDDDCNKSGSYRDHTLEIWTSHMYQSSHPPLHRNRHHCQTIDQKYGPTVI